MKVVIFVKFLKNNCPLITAVLCLLGMFIYRDSFDNLSSYLSSYPDSGVLFLLIIIFWFAIFFLFVDVIILLDTLLKKVYNDRKGK